MTIFILVQVNDKIGLESNYKTVLKMNIIVSIRNDYAIAIIANKDPNKNTERIYWFISSYSLYVVNFKRFKILTSGFILAMLFKLSSCVKKRSCSGYK